MPTYVYACDQCGAEFEQFQRFSDEPLKSCPRCEGQVRRVFQPVGVVFKGSGWYITDSRKGSSATVGGASSAGASPSASPAAETASSDAPAASDTAADSSAKPSTSESASAEAKAA